MNYLVAVVFALAGFLVGTYDLGIAGAAGMVIALIAMAVLRCVFDRRYSLSKDPSTRNVLEYLEQVPRPAALKHLAGRYPDDTRPTHPVKAALFDDAVLRALLVGPATPAILISRIVMEDGGFGQDECMDKISEALKRFRLSGAVERRLDGAVFTYKLASWVKGGPHPSSCSEAEVDAALDSLVKKTAEDSP